MDLVNYLVGYEKDDFYGKGGVCMTLPFLESIQQKYCLTLSRDTFIIIYVHE